MKKNELIRCPWSMDDQDYIFYHDNKWGVPLHNDEDLFELLTLEGAQAGLSWLTILKRQSEYKKAFCNFDIKKVASFSDKQLNDLISNSTIIRNKLKIYSVRQNAKAIIKIQKEFGSFNKYLWSFVNFKTLVHNFSIMSELPSKDNISIAISKDLKSRGLNFVGPTICYAFMQSSGMVNDHLTNCFRYSELKNF